MPISQAKKKEVVQDLHEKFSESSAVLVTDHTGLRVKDLTVLRKRFRDASLDYRVVKNTLARIAVKETGKEPLEEYFEGPSSLLFLGQDVVEGTKILTEFVREKEAPAIRVGLIDDRLYDPKELATIAKLPPKEALLAAVAGGLMSPLNGFAYILTEMVGRFVRAVDAVREQRESSGE